VVNMAAGAFDGWAGQLLGSSVGGLLGILAALVAIWLTRRGDRFKVLQESALQAGEKIVEALAQFVHIWEDTPLVPPDQWYQRLRGRYLDAYLVWQTHAPAIQNAALNKYLSGYHQFMQRVFQEWMNYTRFQVQLSQGSEVAWSKYETQLRSLDDLVRNATFELFDSLNTWRTTLKFDASHIVKIDLDLLTNVHNAIYGTA